MSDTGRQSLTDKAEAKFKPDSEKSTTEHFTDKAKGTTDNVASSFEPRSEKSTTQQAGDTLSGNSNNDESLLDKTKNTLGLNK